MTAESYLRDGTSSKGDSVGPPCREDGIPGGEQPLWGTPPHTLPLRPPGEWKPPLVTPWSPAPPTFQLVNLAESAGPALWLPRTDAFPGSLGHTLCLWGTC